MGVSSENVEAVYHRDAKAGSWTEAVHGGFAKPFISKHP